MRVPGLALLLVLSLGLSSVSAAGEALKAEAKARIQNIEQALDDWNIDAAKRELAALEALVPGDIEPLSYFRARIAFEDGRYADAVAFHEKAGTPDKPLSYLRLAKDTLKVVGEHRRAESEHFIFQYPPGKDEVLAPYALEALEAIRAAMQEDLGHLPTGKIRVEVVNDARELAKVSTLTYEQIRTTGTIAICKFNKLMVTSPKAVLQGYEWLDTLAHEYIHLVVSQKSHNTVPIWLHEGLAKYLESRWRGAAGLAMSPSTLALLGSRVRKNQLIPFEKMHPSMAMLPSAEDAATAFAEVFFAIDLLFKEHGSAALRTLLTEMGQGKSDKRAVELATGKPFAQFERAWLAHVKKQPFPKELVPLDSEKVVLKEDAPGKAAQKNKPKEKEISFGDFAEIRETEPRKMAHLGELLRERGRSRAAAEEYAKAYRVVGAKYESLSNKYALALLETRQLDQARSVLVEALRAHPGSAPSHVYLGRLHLWRKEWDQAKRAYLGALAADPFDEEIHLALARIHEGLGETALAARASKAVVLLTGIPAEKVRDAARILSREAQGPGTQPPTPVPAAEPSNPPASR